MTSIAARAHPPIVTIVALLGLTLVAGREPPAPPERVLPWPGAGHTQLPPISPRSMPDWLAIDQPEPAFRDARAWGDGGMVMGLPATHDRIARNALIDLLSGLFPSLTSLRG